MFTEEEILTKIKIVFEKYRSKFKAKEPKNSQLTEYEEWAGFTPITATGNRTFCNALGRFHEEMLRCAPGIKKFPGKEIDLYSSDAYYQVKSKFNTMTGGLAFRNIASQLKRAIKRKKKFYLLIMSDKDRNSRDMELAKFSGLSNLTSIEGYDPDIHRVITGYNVYCNFFGENADKVLSLLELLFSSLKQ